MIVPNDCANGHDPCGTRDPVRQFDDFLAQEIPKIQASPAFGSDDPRGPRARAVVRRAAHWLEVGACVAAA